MLKNILKLTGLQELSKNEQKNVNGGGLIQMSICSGTGTGGISSEGYSKACIGQSGNCTINGYQASCSGNGGGFWFY